MSRWLVKLRGACRKAYVILVIEEEWITAITLIDRQRLETQSQSEVERYFPPALPAETQNELKCGLGFIAFAFVTDEVNREPVLRKYEPKTVQFGFAQGIGLVVL